jgi:hypothetical protein
MNLRGLPALLNGIGVFPLSTGFHELDTPREDRSMDEYDDASAEDHVLIFNASDDALERAAGVTAGQAWTMNYCTYNYYQCGPIGSRT